MTMKTPDKTSGASWPAQIIPSDPSFDSKNSSLSPIKSYTYRTPGLSVSRSFDKETFISSKDPTPPSPTTALVHMPDVESPTQSKTCPKKRLYKRETDDGSDTSDTTGSEEGREAQRRQANEVELVAMDMNEVVVQDGMGHSCEDVENTSHCVAQVGADSQYKKHGDFYHLEGEHIDNKAPNNAKSKELCSQLPERQKSAMQAFLTSPTNLNWDDLVRSMREEMFIQTITIPRNKSDDSSLGSLGSSNGENKSVRSMDSSLSSKSAFRTRKRRGKKGRGKHAYNRKKRESLEKRVEKVLLTKGSSGVGKNTPQTHPESHPFLTKSKVGGKRCAFSAVTKLPSIPCSPNTPLDSTDSESENHLAFPPVIERETWFHPVEQSPFTPCEESGLMVHHPMVTPTQHSQVRRKEAEGVSSHPQLNDVDAPMANTKVEDPPLLLKLSTSADSDEDSFYYLIRGKSASKHFDLGFSSSVPSPPKPKSGGSSSSKNKELKNPYAFSNHPLLPIVMEEGNISPFPTTFDELDSEDEPTSDAKDEGVGQKECDEAAGLALGSFAASIGKVGANASHQNRLAMYSTSKPRKRRKKSCWSVMTCWFRRNKAEF
ncbi:hypothetical protein ACHAW6_005162 [Cyclotella cf. meneghiniana]